MGGVKEGEFDECVVGWPYVMKGMGCLVEPLLEPGTGKGGEEL